MEVIVDIIRILMIINIQNNGKISVHIINIQPTNQSILNLE